MAKFFTKGFKPKSTTKEAKQIIRNEINYYFDPSEYNSAQTSLQAMKIDADSYNNGRPKNIWQSDYHKGAGLVDAGCFACYYSDQSKMLGKIYGQDNVANWSGQKIHSTYRHLIGREYNAMLTEQAHGGARWKLRFTLPMSL